MVLVIGLEVGLSLGLDIGLGMGLGVRLGVRLGSPGRLEGDWPSGDIPLKSRLETAQNLP